MKALHDRAGDPSRSLAAAGSVPAAEGTVSTLDALANLLPLLRQLDLRRRREAEPNHNPDDANGSR
jgi:hypothetical protein